MIHGDLKGVRFQQLGPPIILNLSAKGNILIDQTGHARLADFGLLTIVSDSTNGFSSDSYTQGGTARWMGPELIAPQRFGFKNSRPTKSSDCYAFGMVIYETISGHLPFHEHTDLEVFVKILEGERPPREVRFTDSLWRVLELCWKPHPNDRPSIEEVLRCLEMEPPSPSPVEGVEDVADEGSEEDSDDWDSGWDSGDGSSCRFLISSHPQSLMVHTFTWTQRNHLVSLGLDPEL